MSDILQEAEGRLSDMWLPKDKQLLRDLIARIKELDIQASHQTSYLGRLEAEFLTLCYVTSFWDADAAHAALAKIRVGE